MKQLLVGVLAAFILLIVGGLGLFLGIKISTSENKMVIGGVATSPDGKLMATLNAVTVKNKGAQYFYEFSLHGTSSEEQRLKTNYPFTTHPIKTIRIPVASEDQLIKRRGVPPYQIIWSADSKTVKTKLDGVEITICVDEVSQAAPVK